MVSKLELKLLEYEKQTAILNDQDLLAVVEKIIRDEEKLPYEQRDYDIIEEAVEFILYLKQTNIKELEDRSKEIVRNNINKTKMDKRKKRSFKPKIMKWSVIIAAIIAAMIISSVAAISKGHEIFYLPKKILTQLSEKIVYSDGDKDIIISSDFREYHSLDDYLEHERTEGTLVPNSLPVGYQLQKIIVIDFGDYDDITFSISNGDVNINISLVTNFENINNSNTNCTIGKYDLEYREYDNQCSADFAYKGVHYQIVASSYDEIKIIIENLEEK